MRLKIVSIFAFLVLIACGAFTALEIDRRKQIAMYRDCSANADAKERREDEFEQMVVKRVSPGSNVDLDPLFRLTVDRVVTEVESEEFDTMCQFVGSSIEGAPASFENCEFHEFRFLESSGATESVYVVIVRENLCVLVFNPVVSLRSI